METFYLYLSKLERCKTICELDEIMFDAATDYYLSAGDYFRLCHCVRQMIIDKGLMLYVGSSQD